MNSHLVAFNAAFGSLSLLINPGAVVSQNSALAQYVGITTAQEKVELRGSAVDLLRIIAYNTAATAQSQNSTRFIYPTFGQGGPISGPSHSMGGVNINAEGGEYMLRRSAVDQIGLYALDFANENGRMPTTTNVVALPTAPQRNSDTSAIVEELRGLRADNAKQKEELQKLSIQLANYIGKSIGDGVKYVREGLEEEVGEGSKRIASEIRMSDRAAAQRR